MTTENKKKYNYRDYFKTNLNEKINSLKGRMERLKEKISTLESSLQISKIEMKNFESLKIHLEKELKEAK